MFGKEEPRYMSTAQPDTLSYDVSDGDPLDQLDRVDGVSLDVVMLPVADLKHADYNPRFITDVDFENLKRSIEKFGFVQPIVVNMHPGRENIIVGGHMRVEAAKRLGMTEVPCIIRHYDEIKEKEANLALNKISGEWDEIKLGEVLLELEEHGGEIELTGFSPDEVDKYTNKDPELVVEDDKEERDSKLGKTVECPHCHRSFEV